MFRKCATYGAEFIFAVGRAAGMASKWRLLRHTLAFHWRNAWKRRANSGRSMEIGLHLHRSCRSLTLRPGAGDLFILYEIFLHEVYATPHWAGRENDVQTIVDCGSNIGLASLYFADRYPRARVYAIEPHPDNFRLLCRNVAAETRILPVHACIAAQRDAERFITLDKLAYDNRTNARGDGVAVPVETIGSLCERFDIRTIDLLKVDIEGAEEELFAQPSFLPRVRQILVELHGDYGIHSFRRDLAPYGFTAMPPGGRDGAKVVTAFPSQLPETITPEPAACAV